MEREKLEEASSDAIFSLHNERQDRRCPLRKARRVTYRLASSIALRGCPPSQLGDPVDGFEGSSAHATGDRAGRWGARYHRD